MKVHKWTSKWLALCVAWPLFEDWEVNGIRWSKKWSKVTCKRCLFYEGLDFDRERDA